MIEIISNIIEEVKKSETLNNVANVAVDNLEKAYKQAHKDIDMDYIDSYEGSVYVDYVTATKDFVETIEDELDIDLNEIIKSDEFQEGEEMGWNDYCGCIDNKYQFALFVLSNVNDSYILDDLFFTGDLYFPIDEDLINII